MVRATLPMGVTLLSQGEHALSVAVATLRAALAVGVKILKI